MSSSQIGVECLSKLLSAHDVKIIDGSWALDGTDMKASFLTAHITTAQFFDIEAIRDHNIDLPHMAPSPAKFAEAMGEMGISETDHVVIYDQQGLFSAARVWWTFKLMGHAKVQVLKGGFPAWQAADQPVTEDIHSPRQAAYRPDFQDRMVIGMDEIIAGLDHDQFMIFDARPRARFHGLVPEPRAGLRGGHIPQSHSLPYTELITEGQLKSKDELHAIFAQTGLTPDKTVVTTCGSGVTAAILAFALSEIGHEKVRLYDGSWAQWGQEQLSTPISI
ncbi:3-mercaptopyruvate sulfurtransferase [Asticcacaulis sp. ZE23SCel15]|uniref:3-mercaptopyruvate sulfurtransferase n=1 Tax=Asticcacaulis sp. ZE23SCel15 TaxID=3059027 RepID=UPI00265E12FC|nr:3-mercaptopyruvate sulfurtransferase [Asticcacaulis sp. ZE23SCel15]WKL56613.1 3-mercaptopyruvate sulfurtransferase [Asticcacaulis sp. ZE23SCel15]